MSGSPARDSVTVVVIAKTPVPGRVKTRLCPPCTPEQAARIAEAALLDTFDAVLGAHVTRRAVALEGQAGPWIPPAFEVVAQRGDGLDERLAAVVTDIGGPLVIIGMDTPQVTPSLIDGVVDALGAPDVDAVLGLADDGGYWVIALTDTRPDAIVGVPMSTDTTGADQLARLQALGLRTSIVGPLCDVDTFDEAVAVSRLIPGSRFSDAVDAVTQVDAVTPVDAVAAASRG